LSTILSAAMVATLLVGCGGQAASTTTSEPAHAKTEEAAAPAASTETTEAGGELNFKIVVKSFQSSYWQAAVTGVNQAAEELGVKVECNGPNAESDIADQVNMLTNYINGAPDGIGLAACDQSACLDALQMAKDAGIPVVCFDSGCPDAPEGSVLSTIATDNYGAGATAADNLYAALKDSIASASAPVRIGEVNQESTSESITQRGLGFIDRFTELATADGKKVAVVGNEFYVNGAKDKGDEASADIIIEVAVPAQTTVELCATEASAIMNKSDVLGIFGSNQVAAEGILSANENLGKLGTEAGTTILAAGFDAGTVIKQAIKDGKMFGAVTQSPLAMGKTTVQTLYKIANGETVSDIATDGYWYDNSNMDAADIAPNLYD
jgi:ribose transport system substrate-binding protein